MESIALDTNIAIDLLNGKTAVIDFLSEVELIYLPIPVCGELLFGAKNSSKSTINEPKYQRFINGCYILNSSLIVAEEYARIRLELKSKGRPIPENDIWIAAICLINEVPLFTRDKHLSYIQGWEIHPIE